ncbi:MAG: efflux RND transporter periplasmic adaptor subunit [Candidatus Riflebacteria bacterium]|nr:efflux RND transporter periplasmic adaptor subunit [Candidatus Riflebacteria bacterium]
MTARNNPRFVALLSAVALLAITGGPLPAVLAQDSFVEARLQPVPLTEEVVGNLQPRMVTTLSSKVMGNVLEVLKREGDPVTAGETLVRIDAQDLGNDLAGARAVLSEAGAAGAEVEGHLATARLAREEAAAQASLAEATFNRIKELFDKKSVTKQEFDQAETALTQARSRVAQADSQIQVLQAKRAQVTAKAAQAQAGISKVSTIKALAEVKAPFDGRITGRRIEPGMLAAPGVPLLIVEDVGMIRFEAIVPERLLSFLPEGASVAVRVDAVAGTDFPGVVTEIVPGADPLSHTFLFKIALPADPRLRSGMYARGLVAKGEEQVLLVPRAAIESRGQLDGVRVQVDGRTVYRLVKTGRTHGDQVEILSGLRPGDRFAPAGAGR